MIPPRRRGGASRLASHLFPGRPLPCSLIFTCSPRELGLGLGEAGVYSVCGSLSLSMTIGSQPGKTAKAGRVGDQVTVFKGQAEGSLASEVNLYLRMLVWRTWAGQSGGLSPLFKLKHWDTGGRGAGAGSHVQVDLGGFLPQLPGRLWP